jgi:general secretion pathway protein G
MGMTLSSSDPHPGNSGFTLIEILMVIILIGILVALSTGSLTGSINEARFQQTVLKLRQIRNAMVGDPEIKENGSRTSFGFLGDMGAVPNAADSAGILKLSAGTGLAAFAVDPVTRLSTGWNGPYLGQGSTGEDYTLDAWGNTIEFVHSPAGSSPYTITSKGADGAAGGSGLNQDIVMSIPKESVLVTVAGFVCQNGGPYSGATEVTLNLPDGSGAVTSQSSVPNAEGYFSFSNVPIGIRSIELYDTSTSPPVKAAGPTLLTIDRPNYMVPCSAVDIGN